jgi:hypothetical protein
MRADSRGRSGHRTGRGGGRSGRAMPIPIPVVLREFTDGDASRPTGSAAGGPHGPVFLDTVTLTDLGGSTLLCQSTISQSVEDRDRYLTAGAEAGVRGSMERLDALVVELARRR